MKYNLHLCNVVNYGNKAAVTWKHSSIILKFQELEKKYTEKKSRLLMCGRLRVQKHANEADLHP